MVQNKEKIYVLQWAYWSEEYSWVRTTSSKPGWMSSKTSLVVKEETIKNIHGFTFFIFKTWLNVVRDTPWYWNYSPLSEIALILLTNIFVLGCDTYDLPSISNKSTNLVLYFPLSVFSVNTKQRLKWKVGFCSLLVSIVFI